MKLRKLKKARWTRMGCVLKNLVSWKLLLIVCNIFLTLVPELLEFFTI
jgi:hypothetical protein